MIDFRSDRKEKYFDKERTPLCWNEAGEETGRQTQEVLAYV